MRNSRTRFARTAPAGSTRRSRRTSEVSETGDAGSEIERRGDYDKRRRERRPHLNRLGARLRSRSLEAAQIAGAGWLRRVAIVVAPLFNPPFYLAGAIKIACDLMLYRSLAGLRPPDEAPQARGSYPDSSIPGL